MNVIQKIKYAEEQTETDFKLFKQKIKSYYKIIYMFKTATIDYHQFFFQETRLDINKTLKFINTFCESKNIKTLKEYFWYRSEQTQPYPDSLDHLFRGSLSVYYLACNSLFYEYFYHLHADLREDLSNFLKFEERKQVIQENKYLKQYLKKILKRNFIF